jgi:hypothetical protein
MPTAWLPPRHVYLSVSVRFSRHSSPFFSAASFSASYPTSLYLLFFMEIFINIFRMKNHLYLPRPFLLLLLLNFSKVLNTKDQTWDLMHCYSKYNFTVEEGQKPIFSKLTVVILYTGKQASALCVK